MAAIRPLERGVRTVAWPSWSLADGDASAVVIRAAGAVSAAAATACAAVLLLRRLSGAIEPAGPVLLLGATAAGVALVLVADTARRVGAPLIGPVAARVGLALAVAALAYPPPARDVAGWAVVAAAVAVVTAAVARLPRRAARAAGAAGTSLRRGRSARPGSRSRRDVRPGLLRQRIERRELAEGAELVRGRIVVAVPAGARTGYGHLGFCPAFAATPTVEVTTAYDGVEATVTAAEVLPWGVRVECRLAEPAEEPLEIPVDLVALAPAAASP